MPTNKPVILGLGNPLFQDEGLGIHVVHYLFQDKLLAEKAEIIDGGTGGIMLLGVVEEAAKLLVIDAIDGGFAPGTICRLENDEIPGLAKSKLSQHQVDFQEVLTLARMRGHLPDSIVFIGVQPQSTNWGIELTPLIAKYADRVKEMIVDQINSWTYSEVQNFK